MCLSQPCLASLQTRVSPQSFWSELAESQGHKRPVEMQSSPILERSHPVGQAGAWGLTGNTAVCLPTPQSSSQNWVTASLAEGCEQSSQGSQGRGKQPRVRIPLPTVWDSQLQLWKPQGVASRGISQHISRESTKQARVAAPGLHAQDGSPQSCWSLWPSRGNPRQEQLSPALSRPAGGYSRSASLECRFQELQTTSLLQAGDSFRIAYFLLHKGCSYQLLTIIS